MRACSQPRLSKQPGNRLGVKCLRPSAATTSILLPSTSRAHILCQAASGGSERSGGGRALRDISLLEALEVAVPRDQRPSNELQQLKDDFLYSWGTLPLNEYVQRIGLVYAFFFALLGGPISYQTFNPSQQPLEWFLAGSTGTLLVVAVVVVRIFLGWSYVGDRLLSAAIPYEETGWYDGETFVKPPEILTRDRLLGMYEAKPVLAKLRGTLVGTGVVLVASTVLLAGLIRSDTNENGFYGREAAYAPRLITASGPIFSKDVKDLGQLADDPVLAAKEAEAAGGMPGYCRDRLFKAYAGGQYCPDV